MLTVFDRISAAFPDIATSKLASFQCNWLCLDVDGTYFVITHVGSCKKSFFKLFDMGEWSWEIPVGLNIDYQIWACARMSERLEALKQC